MAGNVLTVARRIRRYHEDLAEEPNAESTPKNSTSPKL
jgi:hypothetical protein